MTTTPPTDPRDPTPPRPRGPGDIDPAHELYVDLVLDARWQLAMRIADRGLETWILA